MYIIIWGRKNNAWPTTPKASRSIKCILPFGKSLKNINFVEL